MPDMYARILNSDNTVDAEFVALTRADGSGASVRITSDSLETAAYQAWLSAGNQPQVPVPPPIDLKAYVSARRWQVETDGVVVGGLRLPTDREGRSALKQARDMCRDGELLDAAGNVRTTLDITVGGVPIQGVTIAQATDMLKAIGRHVQAAFTVEAQVLSGIAQGSIVTTAAIDRAPWPPNG